MSNANVMKSIVAVQGAVQNVVKDTTGQVGNQKYKYATLDAVLGELRPLLKANKLAVIQSVCDDKLKTTIVHETGETYEGGEYPLGVLDTHQKRGSAITYGRRYVLCALFGIAQEDDDAASAGDVKPKVEPKPTVTLEQRVQRALEAIEKTKTADELERIVSSVNYRNLLQDVDGTEHKEKLMGTVMGMHIIHGGGNV